MEIHNSLLKGRDWVPKSNYRQLPDYLKREKYADIEDKTNGIWLTGAFKRLQQT